MLSVDPPPQLPSLPNSTVPTPLRSPSPPRDIYRERDRDPISAPTAYRPAPAPPKPKSSINGPGSVPGIGNGPGSIISSQRTAPPPPPASVQHSQGGGIPQASRPAPAGPKIDQPISATVGQAVALNTAPLQVKKTPRSHSPHAKQQSQGRVEQGQAIGGVANGITAGTAPAGTTGATPRRREPKPGDKEKEANIIRRLQVICTDADPTKLYKSFTKIGQG